MARDIAGLDFFAITDHDYWPNDMTNSDWTKIHDAANLFNNDGVFTAFWGFEWTSDIEENNNGDKGLGQYTTSFDKFDFKYSDNIVGMELWNRNSGFSYYYNNGYNKNDGGLGYFDEALKLGWYIGAAGGQDNHDKSWGTMNDYRIAVLANEKTRKDILGAFKARRFYSTADKPIIVIHC